MTRHISPAFFGVVVALVATASCTPPYVVPRGVPSSPSPTPTASASPTPVPQPLTANPTSLALNGTGATYAQTSAVQETGYTGTFSETDTCSGIAVISWVTQNGPAATLNVTGSASGPCTATVADSNGQHVAINITVTVTNIGVDRHGRR